jgi:hypothetical protein
MAKFGKIWSACEQHEIQYTEQRITEITYNYVNNFTHASVYVQ